LPIYTLTFIIFGIFLNGAINYMSKTQELETTEIMEDDIENLSMGELLALEEYSLNIPKSGETRPGVIASVANDEILVSIGAKSEGVIPSKEIALLSDEEKAKLTVGSEITVFVVSAESKQGNLILSITRALEEGDWQKTEALMESKEIYEGEISGFNKGGLIVNVGHLRGFVPASQVSLSRRMSYSGDSPEQRWGDMTGESIMVRVIEVDRARRRLILSEKAASQESRESLKLRLLEDLTEGEVRTGRVTSLANFGAFVNINGADGLVHLSEISWDRIDHPNEVLEVGKEIDVKIISIDTEKKRIGLSIRQLQNDPWNENIKVINEGQLVECTIIRLTKFGAFAQINENLEGLIHVSELSEERVEHPKEIVSEGDRLTLRIIKIDIDRRRIGLSLRKVESQQYSDQDWDLALSTLDIEKTADAEVVTEDETVAEVVIEEVVEEVVVEETTNSEEETKE
jgi:small subunit ribosomal protein S1